MSSIIGREMCGCAVERKPGGVRIVYCDLHAAAGEMQDRGWAFLSELWRISDRYPVFFDNIDHFLGSEIEQLRAALDSARGEAQ